MSDQINPSNNDDTQETKPAEGEKTEATATIGK